MKDYLTFRKFDSENEALAVKELLEKNNIPVMIRKERAVLDRAIIGQQFDPSFELKIPASCFNEAEDLLIGAVVLDDPEPDYYLLSFSDDELREIVEKRDEWGHYDYVLALKLLKDRGVEISKVQLDSFRQQRMQELAKPDDGSSIWTVIGYLISLLGTFAGPFIGLAILVSRKTLPDGSSVYSFSPRIRKHGGNMFILSIVSFCWWMYYIWAFRQMPPGLHSIAGLFDLFL